jgi:DNA-binding NtrC family response regulator
VNTSFFRVRAQRDLFLVCRKTPEDIALAERLSLKRRVHPIAREEAIDRISAERPELIVIDGELLRAIGPTFVQHIYAAVPDSTIVLMVEAYTKDAIDLAMTANATAMAQRTADLVEVHRVIDREIARLSGGSGADVEAEELDLIGESSPMQEVRRQIALAAPSSASVLLTGETGTGKELVGRMLHRLSSRRAAPFVAMNCAAIPEALLEAELFGHVKGAFTGAIAARPGRFELAHGGTLFLDEIGELPLGMQAKFLRVLQERSFERVGDTERREVDVRIIAATNRDLDRDVAEGRFRSDLFYRLNVLSIHLPPLHERKTDIRLLWEHFIARALASEGRSMTTSPRAMSMLLGYRWPGNVRELENLARHVTAMSSSSMVTEDVLPPTVIPPRTPGDTPMIQVPGMTLAELERSAILLTYRGLGGNANATADALGISVRKVHYRLREYREEGWLPRTGSEVRPRSSSAAKLLARRPRLLLAEDDDDVRWSLTEILQTEGFEVIAVSSGSALLEHLGSAFLFEQRNTPPDVIVSDVRMPGVSGLTVLEGVRQRGWSIPVVLITAFGDDELRARASRLDATLLSKPLDLNELQAALARAMENQVQA